MLVIPEEGTGFVITLIRRRERTEGKWMEKLFTLHQERGNTNNNYFFFFVPILTSRCREKASLTFLRHVVHAVGHRRALLLGVQGGEASVVVHKVVVCKKTAAI